MNDKAEKGAMQVDVQLVRDLAALLDDTNLTEIEVEDGDRKIRVARKAGGNAAPAYITAPAPVAESLTVIRRTGPVSASHQPERWPSKRDWDATDRLSCAPKGRMMRAGSRRIQVWSCGLEYPSGREQPVPPDRSPGGRASFCRPFAPP